MSFTTIKCLADKVSPSAFSLHVFDSQTDAAWRCSPCASLPATSIDKDKAVHSTHVMTLADWHCLSLHLMSPARTVK